MRLLANRGSTRERAMNTFAHTMRRSTCSIGQNGLDPLQIPLRVNATYARVYAGHFEEALRRIAWIESDGPRGRRFLADHVFAAVSAC